MTRILTHTDFEHVDASVAKLFMMLGMKCEEEGRPVPFNYSVLGGVANRALWFACANKQTAEFFKKNCEELEAPGDFVGLYTYKVYSADEKLYRYMRAKIPARFWEKETKVLVNQLRFSNPLLRKMYVGWNLQGIPLPDGGWHG